MTQVSQSEFSSPAVQMVKHSSSVFVVTDERLGVSPLASFLPRSNVFDTLRSFFKHVYYIYF